VTSFYDNYPFSIKFKQYSYFINIANKLSCIFYRNIVQMLQAKDERIHRVTVVPTNDESSLKEEQTAETSLLTDGT
jgi:hypothetical protein